MLTASKRKKIEWFLNSSVRAPQLAKDIIRELLEYIDKLTKAEEKVERIKACVKMAEDWCDKQLMGEGQICMAALKDVRRIANDHR